MSELHKDLLIASLTERLNNLNYLLFSYDGLMEDRNRWRDVAESYRAILVAHITSSDEDIEEAHKKYHHIKRHG